MLRTHWFEQARDGKVPTHALRVPTAGSDTLYVARGKVDSGGSGSGGTVVLGKVHPEHGCAYFPHKGREMRMTVYDVLCVRLDAAVAQWKPAAEYADWTPGGGGGGGDTLVVCDCDENRHGPTDGSGRKSGALVVASAFVAGNRIPGCWRQPAAGGDGMGSFPYGGRAHLRQKEFCECGTVWFQEASNGSVPDYAFQIPVGRGDEVQYVALASLKNTQAFGAVVPAERTGIFPLHGEQREATYEVLCATPATRLTWEPSARWARATSRGDGARLVVAEAAGIVVASRVYGDGRRLLGKWHHPMFSDGGARFVRDGDEVCERDGVEVLVVSPALPVYASEVRAELAAFSEGVLAIARLAGRLAAAGNKNDLRAVMDAVKQAVDAVAVRVQAFTERLEKLAEAVGTDSESIVAAQDVLRRVKERKAAELKAQREAAAAQRKTLEKHRAMQAEAWKKLRESQRLRAGEDCKNRNLPIGVGTIFGPDVEDEANKWTKVIESMAQSLKCTEREIEALQLDLAAAEASMRKLETELCHFQSSGEELQTILAIYFDVITQIRDDERQMQELTERTRVWQSVYDANAFATVHAVLDCVKATITTAQERRLVEFEFPKLIEEVTTAQLAWEGAERASTFESKDNIVREGVGGGHLIHLARALRHIVASTIKAVGDRN
ncbi:hypothetical protein DFJ73DRAFT_785719 [Zopfochytrium polystomum]|nr:hypothetical protein DFJ73DRAFT_785719 [Zopfochytrium polystomum]